MNEEGYRAYIEEKMGTPGFNALVGSRLQPQPRQPAALSPALGP